MPIFLNAYLLRAPDVDIETKVIPYDKDVLEALRLEYANTHIFRRDGDEICAITSDGSFPFDGERRDVRLREKFSLLRFLAKDGIKRHLTSIKRRPIGFKPIEVVSSRPEDSLLVPILGAEYPFEVSAKYTLDTRMVGGKPFLIIDSASKRRVRETCAYFLGQDFNLIGRLVAVEQSDGYRKVLGVVSGVSGDVLEVLTDEGSVLDVPASSVFLLASTRNFDDYILKTHGARRDSTIERIVSRLSVFNSGESKKNRIETMKKYIQKAGITLINGVRVEIEDARAVQDETENLRKPIYVFNDGKEVDWTERGLTNFGPYTKRTFDRNDPSICVICSKHDQGRVEQFVRKLLKGIPGSRYFSNGLEGKFSIGTSQVDVFATVRDDVASYKDAIEAAIKKKTEEGGRWDLALVQVRQSFKALDAPQNPYYWGKSLFFLHHVPVQDFTIELLDQNDYSLGFSLNNMALACYAKMGGVPWLLKSSPTLSHELVIGIGSANIEREEGDGSERIMGITTVFSGDGSYIVSNTSKAVPPRDYQSALTTVLSDTIDKIQKRMNWQQGDTIRLVFHASVKKFSKEEIEAVHLVIQKYRNYEIEYAFLKISEDHGLHMFDSATAGDKKGKFAPPRGKAMRLSKYEVLLYLIGNRELRQESDGHPRGIIIEIHRDSTFKDLTYLTMQLYGFAAHSWRSYFPNPMPVTISYSDLIARNLGWLKRIPGWNDTAMIGKIGQSQWFL